MEIFELVYERIKENKAFVLATIVKDSGSSPGKTGFKLLVDPDGKSFGTVGGGAIERKVIEESLKRLSTGESGLRDYLLANKVDKEKEDVEIIPMACNGAVSIYYEVYGEMPVIYIFGGGHVGHALLHVLAPLNFYKILIDNREEFANKNVNPDASEIHCKDYTEYLENFEPRKNAFYISLTHGHTYDFDVLKGIYSRKVDAKYIGVIASKNKARVLLEKLKKELGDDIDLSTFRSPVGLQIGGDTAAEIAIDIAAELLSIRYNKKP